MIGRFARGANLRLSRRTEHPWLTESPCGALRPLTGGTLTRPRDGRTLTINPRFSVLTSPCGLRLFELRPVRWHIIYLFYLIEWPSWFHSS